MRKNNKAKQINFDEVVSDSIPIAEELSSVERPLDKMVFYSTFAIAIVFASIFLGKTFFLAGIEHEKYAKRAQANVNQQIPLIAPRGIIVDRNNIPLVKNEAIFSVFLKLDKMIRKGERGAVLAITKDILGLNDTDVLDAINNMNFDGTTNIILAKNISLEQAVEIRTFNLASLIIKNDYRRVYIDSAFSHVVGYVGLVNSRDLRENSDLVINDFIGRAGLEAFYDSEIRGKNGAISISRDAHGALESINRASEPIAGARIKTTIDQELQRHFYNSMSQTLSSLGRTSGVGIAMDPRNGQILTLLSFPSFDAGNLAEYLDDPNQPLFNRAISGVYSPGSVIKPMHAAAALNQGVVSPDTQIFSSGYIEIPNPFFPDKPSRFLDWDTHGWVDVRSAIARSSNVYFYTVIGGFEDARGIGINKLREYWKHFGFGNPTGIDLPGEKAGFLPSPEEKKERKNDIWRIGDTYNIAIGQGDFRITPIELLNGISAIANNGKAFVPHIVKADPIEIIDVSWLGEILGHIQQGMKDTIQKPYGTASQLNRLPISIAGKTGSAQISNNIKTNAFFVGYAPADNPEIVILILIEDAVDGSVNTIPIAHDVFEWYYENRL